MKQKSELPMMLSFHASDLREQTEAVPEGTALIGISTTGRAIAVDLDAESRTSWSAPSTAAAAPRSCAP
ncbi:hypothetical protein ACPCB7_00025 [Streptomyces arboris]|uniref:hypothetical protein n=1 Tax=Streptomyces arboris TaxID=2600619 RepID=UPI003C2F50D1